jgi:biopolymer transport protein ExbD
VDGELPFMLRRRTGSAKVELNMTPMIDVVFQLLAFFMLTFTVLAREGDFVIKSARLPPATGVPRDIVDLPERVVLEADDAGVLTGIVFRGGRYRGIVEFAASLTAGIRCHEVEGKQPTTEFEIVCPDRLKYAYVIGVLDVVEPRAERMRLVTREE